MKQQMKQKEKLEQVCDLQIKLLLLSNWANSLENHSRRIVKIKKKLQKLQ